MGMMNVLSCSLQNVARPDLEGKDGLFLLPVFLEPELR